MPNWNYTKIQRLRNLNEGMVNVLSCLDEDRPTILSKLNKIEKGWPVPVMGWRRPTTAVRGTTKRLDVI